MPFGASARGAAVTGDLVFVQSRGPGLFAIGADGAGIRRLTSARDEDPALSPDGSRLAFVRNRRGAFELYVADASAANGLQEPTWRPY